MSLIPAREPTGLRSPPTSRVGDHAAQARRRGIRLDGNSANAHNSFGRRFLGARLLAMATAAALRRAGRSALRKSAAPVAADAEPMGFGATGLKECGGRRCGCGYVLAGQSATGTSPI